MLTWTKGHERRTRPAAQEGTAPTPRSSNSPSRAGVGLELTESIPFARPAISAEAPSLADESVGLTKARDAKADSSAIMRVTANEIGVPDQWRGARSAAHEAPVESTLPRSCDRYAPGYTQRIPASEGAHLAAVSAPASRCTEGSRRLFFSEVECQSLNVAPESISRALHSREISRNAAAKIGGRKRKDS